MHARTLKALLGKVVPKPAVTLEILQRLEAESQRGLRVALEVRIETTARAKRVARNALLHTCRIGAVSVGLVGDIGGIHAVIRTQDLLQRAQRLGASAELPRLLRDHHELHQFGVALVAQVNLAQGKFGGVAKIALQGLGHIVPRAIAVQRNNK